MTNTDNQDLKLIAKTIFGLEEVLASELRKIGAREIEILNRAVKFTGDKGMMYKANLCLRTALRVLVPITQFEVHNESDLYDGINHINWETYLDAEDSIAIDTVLNTEIFSHTQFISQKAKDAIVDQFRQKFGKRPDVNLDRPVVRISLHIFENTCSVALDSSGDSLHKRGYRDKTNLAPLNEVLAAGLVLLTGWDRARKLVDPMCGSGTILIEAAMLAANIPPGYYRSEFGFMLWKKFLSFDESLWNTIYESNINRISSDPATITGSELSHNVARKARENIKLARVDDLVQIRESDIIDFIPPEGGGVVIMNPPYGERMDKDDIFELYKSIGDSFKKNFTGYDCWLISSNMD